jgi:hypothetical protein
LTRCRCGRKGGELTGPNQIAERVDEILADPAKRQFVTDLGLAGTIQYGGNSGLSGLPG